MPAFLEWMHSHSSGRIKAGAKHVSGASTAIQTSVPASSRSRTRCGIPASSAIATAAEYVLHLPTIRPPRDQDTPHLGAPGAVVRIPYAFFSGQPSGAWVLGRQRHMGTGHPGATHGQRRSQRSLRSPRGFRLLLDSVSPCMNFLGPQPRRLLIFQKYKTKAASKPLITSPLIRNWVRLSEKRLNP